ncbi:MAG: HlyD family efflux transporter periplasmic adaptor subunit [Pseudomonadota bacterium]
MLIADLLCVRKGWYLIILILSIILCACTDKPTKTFQGYVEGEFVYVGSPIGGRLEELKIQRGQSVAKGDLLFRLEDELEKAVVQEASKKYRQAMDSLANLRKGKRPSEVQAIEARLNRANAALQFARMEYDRRIELSKRQFISEERLDRARTEYDKMRQQVQEIAADLKTAQLGARPDEIKAAQAEAEAVKARIAQAEWNLHQKTQISQRDGLVFDIIYYPGEWVPAGRPVVALLPPENIKVRFFVPEKIVGSLSLGQEVSVSFDGGNPVPAKVSFISPRAQYTPPVIYSSHSRAKLVFMIEAVPDLKSAHLLHPGQPVDVRETLEERPRE